jgi:hypothetical protein
MIRWHATIYYRTDSGFTDVEHDLDEIADLDPLVERGPHWDTIDKIVVERVNHNTAPNLTIEQAEKM